MCVVVRMCVRVCLLVTVCAVFILYAWRVHRAYHWNSNLQAKLNGNGNFQSEMATTATKCCDSCKCFGPKLTSRGMRTGTATGTGMEMALGLRLRLELAPPAPPLMIASESEMPVGTFSSLLLLLWLMRFLAGIECGRMWQNAVVTK